MTRPRIATSMILTAVAVLGSLISGGPPAPAAYAATITIVNLDGPMEGFNDPTPVSPVGGNPGTTIGAQRLYVFQRAANIWATLLRSNVEIRVGAQFDPLSCNATSGVLGSAGPTTVHRDFAGAIFSGTWYQQAGRRGSGGAERHQRHVQLQRGEPDLPFHRLVLRHRR